MTRKVTIQRVKGLDHPHVPIGTVHEGWELAPPVAGERYCLFKENGAIFRSSQVLEVVGDVFRTQNSMYTLRVLEMMEDLKGSKDDLTATDVI